MEKIVLVESRKVVERDPACCEKFPYKLLNGDVAFPKWEVNFGKQILVSTLWFASLVVF